MPGPGRHQITSASDGRDYLVAWAESTAYRVSELRIARIGADGTAAGASTEQLAPALALPRKAQWRIDFVAAESSMGFHAPAEATRILAESIDYARQAQLLAQQSVGARPAPTSMSDRH